MAELKILSVNTSKKKGTIKLPVKKIKVSDMGVSGDAHSGKWHRQLSLLGVESIGKFEKKAKRKINYGEFAENITTEGVELWKTSPLDKIVFGKVELEITQIGKKCHGEKCAIFNEVGTCVMPKEGIFCRVIKGGELKSGDVGEYIPKVYKILIITLSDRASRGEYEDLSGPEISTIIENYLNNKNRKFFIERLIIPDEPKILENKLKSAFTKNYDIIITTGGTGIGPRDITPETVRPLLDKEIPGIIEFIRSKYSVNKPAVLLSRAIAGVKNKTLVFSIPGSVKAVTEYMNEIVNIIDHSLYMMYEIDSH